MTRLRRSCLAVPGSSPKMLAKAATLAADEVFIDLEDAVAPLEKNDATRQQVVDALLEHEWRTRTRAVRVNDASTRWCFRDIAYVVERAAAGLDCIMLPKVRAAGDVALRRPPARAARARARRLAPHRPRGADRERARRREHASRSPTPPIASRR